MLRFIEIETPDDERFRSAEIVSVEVFEGDTVSAGDALFIVKKEKETHELPSPFDGRVAEFIAHKGDRISTRTPLLLLETEVEENGTETQEPDVLPEPEPTSSPDEQDEVTTADIIDTEPDERPIQPDEPAQEIEQEEATTISGIILKVPNISEAEDVEVIEILVTIGDTVSMEDPLITLETDKASMDIPASDTGEVAEILVNVGDKVSQGSAIIRLSEPNAIQNATSGVEAPAVESKPEFEVEPKGESETVSEPTAELESEPAIDSPSATEKASTKTVNVSDIGGYNDVEIIEVLVNVGDQIFTEDSLITLESDKASMDIPSPTDGIVKKILVATGDKVSEGSEIVILSTASDADNPEISPDTNNIMNDEIDTLDTPDISESEEVNVIETSVTPDNAVNSEDPQLTLEGDSPSESNAATEFSDAGATEPAVKITPVASDTGKLHADVVVLGAGPGGYSAAFRAADLGLNVILAEREPTLGGVCLNVGCIPSKALLHAAAVISEARHMEKHGIGFGKPKIDIDKLRGFKESVVNKLTGGLAGLAKQRKVTVVHGEASFASSTSLAVVDDDGQKTVTFDKCIIAAGSRVTIFPIFESDDERVIDSTGALELREIPKKMLIVGGGIIGLEMATVYAELGTEITVCELTDQIIPGADKDIIKPLDKRLRSICKAIHLGTMVTEIKSLKSGIKVSFEGDDAPDAQTYDYVLVATGRRPNGDLISAENAGVKVDEHGFIAVNDQMQTNVPNIFAIGDLAGQPMLAHKAVHEGHVAAEVCAGEKTAFLAKVIPSVAYTDPELAWVGETEISAKANGLKYEKASFPWAASGRALGLDRPEGITKLLFDPETEHIIGAGIVGPGAGDLISEIALAIEMGADAQDIALTIHPHPTLSETVGMAAEMFEGTITDLYVPKKK